MILNFKALTQLYVCSQVEKSVSHPNATDCRVRAFQIVQHGPGLATYASVPYLRPLLYFILPCTLKAEAGSSIKFSRLKSYMWCLNMFYQTALRKGI